MNDDDEVVIIITSRVPPNPQTYHKPLWTLGWPFT